MSVLIIPLMVIKDVNKLTSFERIIDDFLISSPQTVPIDDIPKISSSLRARLISWIIN
jgi:hypothetical protein